jgi:hypothetical protein
MHGEPKIKVLLESACLLSPVLINFRHVWNEHVVEWLCLFSHIFHLQYYWRGVTKILSWSLHQKLWNRSIFDIKVMWDVTPLSLVEMYWLYGGTWCLYVHTISPGGSRFLKILLPRVNLLSWLFLHFFHISADSPFVVISTSHLTLRTGEGEQVGMTICVAFVGHATADCRVAEGGRIKK